MHSGTVRPSCRQSMTPKISVRISYFWKWPWANIYWFFCQYLTSGVIWGLYECQRNTLDATRSFLVDITASRVVFSAILVPRDPCDNSEMCVHARSLVTRLLSQMDFFDIGCHLWPSKMDKYGVCDGDLALVCRNRSKIDLCGPKSVHDHGDGISYLWDLG